MSWTREQQQVIDLRGGNLLVSAAAGSGKTAVLVERILQKITDADHPTDIDRILIVTFTNAAAAEMRERIADALSARLEENPADENLKRQSALLHNAKISTIHSFCLSVIRNQFYRIGLEPSLRVADEGEMKVLRGEVLDALLAERYENPDPAFLHFTAHYASDRSDAPMKEIILQVYDYAMSEPWPKRWLQKCREAYQICDGADAEERLLQSEWMQSLTHMLQAQLSGMAAECTSLIEAACAPQGPEKYKDTIAADRSQLAAAAAAPDFAALQERIRKMEWARLKAVNKTDDVLPEKKELVQKGRARIKKQVENLQKQYFSQTVPQMCANMREAAADAAVLCDLTEAFIDAFEARKRSMNVLDFSDQEHYALRILVDEETQTPTEAALEYRAYFDEIMIDEYQDSNYVQELLLMSISRQDSPSPNVFLVGDVKQSIYGFRLARPDLFMEKYHTYGTALTAENRSVKIELHKNFRSRASVLHSTNTVFCRLMQADIGGIDYNDNNALHHGALQYPQEDPEAYRTEVLLTDHEAGAEEALIAQRIAALLDPADPLMISDGAGGLRPVRCGDIVILMRSLGTRADRIALTLNDAGIPTYVQSKTGYFASPEIRTILAFLQVIDNPRQDIPLAAVLRSPVYGLTGEMLSRIRIGAPDASFYDAVTHYAAEGEDAALWEILNGFLADLADYRTRSRLLQMHELLSYLLRRSGYDKIVLAMPGGSQRLMNIRMLEERAAAFEKTSFHGLFQFNRYLEQLQSYEVDYGEASAAGGNEDAVRILSIHKSKGLEFPVVFLSGLGSPFNREDSSKAVQLHAGYGIGIEVFRETQRTKAATPLRQAICLLNGTETMGEELRVLYVAMTRAREKLILTAGSRQAQQYLAQLQMPHSAAPLSYYARMNAACFLDDLAACLSEVDGSCIARYVPAEALAHADAAQVFARRMKLPVLLQAASEADEALSALLKSRFAQQPQADAEIPAKVSVSELKLERIRENGEDPAELFAQTQKEGYVPSFARGGEEEESGASYGTAVHRILECLDFAGCAERIAQTGDAGAVLEEALSAMWSEGRITQEMYDMVSRRALTAFLESGLFARMQAADRAGALRKEQPFVMSVPAQEVSPEASDAAPVLVQGIIDAYFIEDGAIVLVDYKTDRVKEPLQLIGRYRRQMELYAQALTGGTYRQVKEMLLYSFALDAVCPCEAQEG